VARLLWMAPHFVASLRSERWLPHYDEDRNVLPHSDDNRGGSPNPNGYHDGPSPSRRRVSTQRRWRRLLPSSAMGIPQLPHRQIHQGGSRSSMDPLG
jgi:hypothetical protein